MFAAMVGGQLRQVDNSMTEPSKLHGSATAAARINPHDFLPGRQPQRQPIESSQLAQHTWYSPDEREVMAAVPEPVSTGPAFSPNNIDTTSRPRDVSVARKAPEPSLRQKASQQVVENVELQKLLKSIDKTLKTISKTLIAAWPKSSNSTYNNDTTS
jgi:hypothetical protein